MKNILNRLFCLALCAVLCLGMIPGVGAAAASQTETAYVWGGIDDGYPVYYSQPVTIQVEDTAAAAPVTASVPAMNAITETDGGNFSFTTFADLKALAARTYDSYTYLDYEGDTDLVISEDLTLPDNIALNVQSDKTLVISKGVTLTTSIGSLYVDHLEVQGALVGQSNLLVSKSLTVTGKITISAPVYLFADTVVTGADKVTFTESCYDFIVEHNANSIAELQNAVSIAHTQSSLSHQVNVYFDSPVTLDSSLTVPANTALIIMGSTLTVGSGATLAVNGHIDLHTPLQVDGKLVNNSYILFSGSKMSFRSPDGYSSTGRLTIYAQDPSTELSDILSGLNMDNLEITEETYDYARYWYIKDLSNQVSLGTPEDLQWNKAIQWEYDEDSKTYKPTVVTQYGSILFAPGTVVDDGSGRVYYAIVLYKNGAEIYSTWIGYDTAYLKETPLCTLDLASIVDFTNGTYYFTAQAVSWGDENYHDSEIVQSGTWTYEKPDSRYSRPKSVSWDWPTLKWSKASGNGYKIEVRYSKSKKMTNAHTVTFFSDAPSYELDNSYVCNFGSGYYTFRVRTLSGNITRKYHSAWTEQSKVYYYSGDEKPDAPKLKWSDGNAVLGKNILFWERVPGADQYKVYRATSKSGTYQFVETVGSDYMNSEYYYQDRDAALGKTYYYKVRAMSYTGLNSSYSNVVSHKYTLDAPEVRISVDSETGKPVVEWDTVEDAAKYYIYRSTSKSGTYNKVKTAVSARSYVDTKAKAGTTYYYKVKAVHETASANSPYSAAVKQLCDLAMPEVTIQLNSSGKPYLKWQEISGAKKYYIYRSDSADGEFDYLGSTTSLRYADKKAKSGETWFYKVKAVHSKTSANSAYSPVFSITAE